MFKNSFKDNFMATLFKKVCKIWVPHRTPKNQPHARTSRTLFRMDFARTRVTAHRTCACAHAPSQLIPCKFGQVLNKFRQKFQPYFFCHFKEPKIDARYAPFYGRNCTYNKNGLLLAVWSCTYEEINGTPGLTQGY